MRTKTCFFAKAGSRIAHLLSMQCLRAIAKTTIGTVVQTAVRTKIGKMIATAAVSLAVVIVIGVLVWSDVTPASTLIPHRPPLAELEHNLRRAPAHISEFSPTSEPLALPKCGSIRPPEALLTPDPLLQGRDDDLNVRVSFIVGSDGHVYSPFILVSGSPEEDRLVLRTVRLWRYRPALCNGVPTDYEARVRFIVH